MKRDETSVVALTLRSGVILSAAFLAVGVVLGIPSAPPTLLRFDDVRGIANGIAHLDAGALIHAGVLILMLTPIARIIAVMIEFAKRREISFVLVSIGVLLLLIMTASLGLWGDGR